MHYTEENNLESLDGEMILHKMAYELTWNSRIYPSPDHLELRLYVILHVFPCMRGVQEIVFDQQPV